MYQKKIGKRKKEKGKINSTVVKKGRKFLWVPYFSDWMVSLTNIS